MAHLWCLEDVPKQEFHGLFSLTPQLIFPDLVEGLVLMNIDPNGKGWIDWAATKVSLEPPWPGRGEQ